MGGDVNEGFALDDIVSAAGTLNLLSLPGASPNVRLRQRENEIGHLGTVDIGNGSLALFDEIALTIVGAVSAGSVTLTTPDDVMLSASASITTLSGVTLVVDEATLDGVISGNGGLGDPCRPHRHVPRTAADNYHGFTTVASGTLLVDGSIASSVETGVQNGATLGGHGTVSAVHVLSGGTLAPGDSPGVLTTGNVTLDSGAHFQEIGGTSAVAASTS